MRADVYPDLDDCFKRLLVWAFVGLAICAAFVALLVYMFILCVG